MGDLLPCPFCGGSAKISTRTDECIWSHDQVEWTAVSCSGGPDFDCFQPSVDWPTSATDDAGTQLSISQWNTRAALPAASHPLASDARRALEADDVYGWANSLPAAPAEDVRAGAQMADLSLPTLLKQTREDALREAIKAATGVSVFNPTASQGEINTAVMVLAKVEKAILAMIPGAKP